MQDMQLTRNFKLSEFVPPGTPMPPAAILQNIDRLAHRLQAVRDVLNRPITITSGYRTPQHNAAIPGAVQNSYHTRGMAADIVVEGMQPQDVQRFLSNWSGGLGGYTTHTHVDIRPYTARWGLTVYQT